MAGEPGPRYEDDLELAARLAAQDPDALADLYDRYGPYAFSVAVRILGDPGKAEDVCQEVFLKLWRNAASFDPRRGSFRVWVATAIRNRSIDFLRGRRAHELQEREIPHTVASVEPASDPFSEAARSLDKRSLTAALATLPEEQRHVIVMVYLLGYKMSEVAEMLGAPLATIKGRARLGLEKLRAYLINSGLAEVS